MQKYLVSSMRPMSDAIEAFSRKVSSESCKSVMPLLVTCSKSFFCPFISELQPFIESCFRIPVENVVDLGYVC